MTGATGTGRRDAAEQLGFDVDDLLEERLRAAGSGTRRLRRGPAAPAPATTPPEQLAFEPDGDRPPGEPMGAVRIARVLGRPEPTPEQVAVIEAPVEPMLVIAGAGSGKTETMAARVVWLVANGYVAPQDVLGLTFTRKAAGELAERVRARLRALHRHAQPGVPVAGRSDPDPVTISTYHAYAATIVRDHGLRLGIEPTARLLGEAGAWQLAAQLVERWDGDMSDVESVATSVTEAVLALAAECAEHLVEPGDVADAIETLVERAFSLPSSLGADGPGSPKRDVRERLARLAAQRRMVPLVEAYVRRKRELDLLDFGDQVALAARLAREVPEVGAGERARYPVVLLDEYQDTSHAQLVLLRSLFSGGHPVVAVGDPHQSVYGWRGASAGNLQRFPRDFPRVPGDADGEADPEPAAVRYLATSWRNDEAVLAVANRISAPLRSPAPWADPEVAVPVPSLVARPGAGSGAVLAQWLPAVEDEARAVAEVAAFEWRREAPSTGPPDRQGSKDRPRIAVLCRTRAQFPLFEGALRAQGLPVEVVGLGGLLAVPEVADVRAALEVLADPTRGDALMRLLTGPAWQLGARDLEALGVWSADLLRRGGPATHEGAHRSHTTQAAELDAVQERSVIEALDELPPDDWRGPAGQELSLAGRARLERLAALLRDLRGRIGLTLPDLVLDVERALLLDVEVAARPGISPGAARASLDAFVDVAAGFATHAGSAERSRSAERSGTGARDTPGPSGATGLGSTGLGAFLSWLSAADARERGLESPVTRVREDAVQVLTVHAAKGLEWDVVAVTGLVEGTFPSGHGGRAPNLSNGWLGELGAVPYPLRGDAPGLPHWAVEAAGTQPELDQALQEFRSHCGLHEIAEERRLAYVAVTRARHRLLLTGAVWGDGSTPRTPSRFLLEAAELAPVVGVGEWAGELADGAANPREALHPRAQWPFDPLEGRRAAVEEAAALVRAAMVGSSGSDGETDGLPDTDEEGWAAEVELLLAERGASVRHAIEVPLPAHLSASRVVALAADPVALAGRLRRPMPSEPSPHARRGSAFHAWLEQRFGSAALVDVDELPGAADEADRDAEADAELADLQRRFLASEWADRVPEAVEVAVETPVGGLVVRGRIDAVFRLDGSDGQPRWDVVDWKTGSPPRGEREVFARAVQLAVYRLAWARLNDVDPARVGAAFFYAGTGQTVRPVDLLDAAGLEGLVTAATSGSGG